MHRRKFLASSATVAATSVAGCFGYTIESTDDVERRKNTIEQLEANLQENTSALSKTREELNTTSEQLKQTKSELETTKATVSEQETTISDLRSEKNSLESDVSELESDVSRLESELASVEANTTEVQAKTVLTAYSYAIGLANEGHNLYRLGSDNADNGDYLPASYDFYEGEAYYDSAANVYDLTVDRANAFNFGTISSWADESKTKINLYAKAAADFGLAYLSYAAESTESGNQYIDEGNTHLDNAQDYQSRSLTVLENELDYQINIDDSTDDSNAVRAGSGG